MSNYLNEKASDLTVFNKIRTILEKNNYYGLLSVQHYAPSSPYHRAEASKAFAYWFLKNCSGIDFSNDSIEKYIVDCANDQGIDAVIATSHNWEENGCQDIWFYQFKFYESNVDDDVVDKMRNLWNNVKRGAYGFSGDVYTKLKSLNIFEYLKASGVKVHFVLVITTELDSSAQAKWNRLSQDIRSGSLNYDLVLYDKNNLKQYV